MTYKKKKIRECMEPEFYCFEAALIFFLFPWLPFSCCKRITLTSLMNLSVFLDINANSEVLHEQLRKSTCLFVGQLHAGNYTAGLRLFLLLQFPVFSCVSEN